jgi:hypothetical protein
VTPLRHRPAVALVFAALGLVPGATALASSSAESCLPRPTLDERTVVLSGTTTDDADWTAAFGIDDRDIQLVCVDIVVGGEDSAPGVLGGPFLPADHPDEIVVSVLSTGFREGPRWHVLRGTVPDRVERLELSVDGGEPVEAEIADIGPDTGWNWYAAVVPEEHRGFPHVTATGYDADGKVVAEGESPF